MAQTKQSSLNNSSSYGEGAVRQANVLASCYVIDNAASQLRGFHYCTTTLTAQGQSGIPEVPSSGLPSPPSSPPLAALAANNELTVFPKKRGTHNGGSNTSARRSRRGGATLRIREECERLFCETMKTVFLGERSMASNGSSLTSVFYDDDNEYYHHGHDKYNTHTRPGNGVRSPNGQLFTPPDDPGHFAALRRSSSAGSSSIASSVVAGLHDEGFAPFCTPTAWLELWDFAGCASFRGFVAEDPAGARSLFAFFDAHLLSRDLKQALVALIELADAALGCAHLVICMDRRAMADGADAALADEAAALMKGLQWAGFSLTTLDTWTGGEGVDVTSPSWIFMGMEL